jgi:hypothetical protein
MPGLIAAAIAIVLPIFLVEPAWEAMYSAVAGVVFCLVVRRLESLSQALWSGLLAGAILLLNPALVLFMACWLVYQLWVSTLGKLAACRFLAVFTLAATLVILPWEIRNARVLGGFTFIRDNLGLELYVSNSDCAQVTFLRNVAVGCHTQMHPIVSLPEATAVRSMGELAYNHDRLERAKKWIQAHPQKFWSLTGQRFFGYWFPEGKPAISIATVLSFFGLAVLLVRRRPEAWFFLAVMLVCPIVYYFVQVDGRYRPPLLWITLLLAGYAVDAVVPSLSRRVKGLASR